MSVPTCLARLFFIVIVASIFVIAGPGIAQNAVPMLIDYQGELRDPTTGEPVPDGDYDMTFFLCDVQFGGTPLWQGSHDSTNGNPVQIQEGTFQVLLGSGTGDPLSASLFNGSDRWLEIVVEGETLEPRQRLTSVPYSIVSETSRLLDGHEACDFAGASHLHSGSDIANGIVSEIRIDPAITRDSELSSHAADSAAHHEKTTSFADLTDAAAESQIPPQIARDAEIMPAVLASDGSGSGLDADRLDGLDSSDLLSSSNDYGRFAVASDLYEMTETLTSKYVNVAGPDAVTGSSSDPMLYVTNSGTGYALSCLAESSYAVRGRSSGDDGYGVYGLCHGSDGYGVVGSSGGTDGSGVWGDAGGENGRGVVGIATDSGLVANYGGWFEAFGAEGRAVYGRASTEYLMRNYGGYFEAQGRQSTGVYGEADVYGLRAKSSAHYLGKAVYAEASGDGAVGVYGEATGEESVGVHGKGPMAGVFCEGDLVVTGTSYRGTLGKNNGAPFPRPAYDSGWVEIDRDEEVRLDHNLGGDPDNYVVDLQFMYDFPGHQTRHHTGYGGHGQADVAYPMGGYWKGLTNGIITVHRHGHDNLIDKVRVRIWVYN